ncbi:uncharacterized protein I303_103921 [Kwoniella dejecticola CBS 10117]|uniref:F-box domain-containing protein n=1 Tax=Kwoniella dejecticola CBS 10117 TaxID=1296121 RepID=A0A1A6A831_9TREE|nr:uncharacterized protein I303_03939 [Kwoniella dejecticola CBS 10117]OBR86219.1 hypothetical protein I303_03939 [Kwoniella dejecticola CBS 10117]
MGWFIAVISLVSGIYLYVRARTSPKSEPAKHDPSRNGCTTVARRQSTTMNYSNLPRIHSTSNNDMVFEGQRSKLPDLPDDVWLIIFSHVRRPTEEIMKTASTKPLVPSSSGKGNVQLDLGKWENYHQVEQLRHVRSINFIYAATRSPSRTLNIEGLAIYQRPGQSCDRQFMKSYLAALDSTRYVNTMISQFRMQRKNGDVKLFPNLQQVIMGISPFFSAEWHRWLFCQGASRRYASTGSDVTANYLLTARTEIGNIFAEHLNAISSSPKEMCTHSLHGPWGLSLPPKQLITGKSNLNTIENNQKQPRISSVILDRHFLHRKTAAIWVQPGYDNTWIISKDILAAMIDPFHRWNLTTSDKLKGALIELFKQIRKRLFDSAAMFPKGKKSQATTFNVLFPVDMPAMKRLLSSLRQINARTANQMEDEKVMEGLAEWLMNKGKWYYRYRGITVRVNIRDSDDSSSSSAGWKAGEKEALTCDCYGITYSA